MQLTEYSDYRGQPTWEIRTASATYFYHQRGAGFASLIDPSGSDWVNHGAAAGSAGQYRGIPNLIHPEGGFHPGADTCVSRIAETTGSMVVIDSRSKDKAWSCTWTIEETRAVMKLRKVAHPYWFLYEGTPGGEYHEREAFMVDSGGQQDSCGVLWERRLPDPRWIAFGTPRSAYRLLFADLTDRKADATDLFYSMEENMTVFGFGRVRQSTNTRWMHLTEIPATFVVSLFPATTDGETARAARRILR